MHFWEGKSGVLRRKYHNLSCKTPDLLSKKCIFSIVISILMHFSLNNVFLFNYLIFIYFFCLKNAREHITWFFLRNFRHNIFKSLKRRRTLLCVTLIQYVCDFTPKYRYFYDIFYDCVTVCVKDQQSRTVTAPIALLINSMYIVCIAGPA